MTKQTQSTPYEVGYGKPPKSGQFRKGHSGHKKGRTSGGENMIAVFKRIARKRIKVTDNGVVKTLTMAEVVIRQNVKAALTGDPVAMSNICRMADQGGEFNDMTDVKTVGRPLFMRAKMGLEELLAFHGSNIVEGTPSNQTGVQSDL